MSLANSLAKLANIYLDLSIFIGGTLGNLLHNFLRPNRRNSCVFLFLFSSLMNCIALFYGLFARILSDGFDSYWSTINRIWCKSRVALTPTTFLISLTCICLASMNRFFASCRQEKYRKFTGSNFAHIET
ncbi:unnamed protein product [Rotaria magnacalcarata]|uniref:Uncharacterized protein n=1 Tax=Rotaria magnacalcarata TaxID=392030 RepID=A0A820DGQ5_9BILA|nr:unnamed protein product [Rotaria magnacalcarata]CAF2135495.1 unnamed protein product [Rotaria magnacalcarata]CAF4133920.1 unnamed protein product [Rotaria magnacalcarata]CAF4231726.1 unnamed protein product [Rotaria magnacalcarata]